MHRWILLLFAALTAPVAAQPVAADELTPGQAQAGSLLFRMKSGYVVATRMNTSVEARISGLAGRVAVRQEFINDGTDWVEGVYVFPLPDRAAVDRFRMHVGERFIEGEIREKEAAKKAYETAKSEGKKASLVEQQRANLFTTSVANIAPGESIVIEIEYQETLRYDDGNFSMRIPLTFTPRYIPGQPLPDRKGSGWSPDTTRVTDASLITPPVVTKSSAHKVTFSAVLDSGVPLEFVASRYHVVDITGSNGRYKVSLADDNVPMDHDIELTWKPVADRSPRAMMFTEELDDEIYALLMMLPPDDFAAPVQGVPRELVLVIDTSGSMHGTSIKQAKQALGLALGGLRPADRFNVIQFNSTTSALFPASVAATTANINVARRYVSGLAANGGTEMRPAIELALSSQTTESHLRQVIFITDGSVGNEEALFELIETDLGSSRLFTVGIGSAPNSWFMRKAAEAGRGAFTTISALHEVQEKMEKLIRKVAQPRVTDISVAWPDGAVEAYPATVPDLYAGEPVVVRARLPAGTRTSFPVVVSGQSSLGTWDAEIPWDIGESRPGIAGLWARARIEDLADRLRRGADAVETRSAIVATALKHHLVSRHTSLVAIDKTPARPASAALQQAQVPNLLPYGQTHSAIFGFPATATAAGIYRMNGILLMLIAWLLFIYLRIWRSGNAPRKDD
jgi:Ca-activated chloride channel family protein